MRLAKGHAYMARHVAARLGLDVDLIPGTGDVALVTGLDLDTDARFTLAGDGDWLRAWFVVANAWTEIVPTDFRASYFPVETVGWPEDWLAELTATNGS